MRQRLWGAMVLVAIAVIGLPLLLDGSGSESRFRHVEQLREEPPRIVAPDGAERSPIGEPVSPRPVPTDTATRPVVTGVTPAERSSEPEPRGDRSSGRRGTGASGERAGAAEPGERLDGGVEPLSAWVVQVGSFGAQANAIEVRERLRAAGFPTFVTDTSAPGTASIDPESPTLFRVQVGPMVDRARAAEVRERVVALLGGDPIVVSYP